ncbi:MAG: DUF3089 domain-containing protein [Actinomycetota bacterium]
MPRLTALVVTLVLIAAACGDDGADDAAPATSSPIETTTTLPATTTLPPTTSAAPVLNPYGEFTSEIYADGRNWLCHPAIDEDACDVSLDTTLVHPDGSTEILPHRAADDPQVDCFYVYPTISRDATGNSDFDVSEIEEIYVVRNQAARYSRFCRVFAPVYRQVTLGNIDGVSEGSDVPDAGAVIPGLAESDVLEAWKQYIANDNEGRGVLLIGHSQGSGRLEVLLRNEIIGTDLQRLIVGAHLIGNGPSVPVATAPFVEGYGDFPMCTAADEFACMLGYASYRPDHDFGDGEVDGDTQAMCVNPAAVAGGPAILTPYYPTEPNPAVTVALGEPLGPWDDPARIGEITTPFFTMVDLVEAECVVDDDGRRYFEIRVLADPSNPQADDIHGDIPFLPDFGLHFVDTALGQGDLIAHGEMMADGWLAAQG